MDKDAQIKRAEDLLRAAGFTLSVSGCGCCGSPLVRMTHNGEEIIHDAGDHYGIVENCDINMHGIFPDD